MTPYQVKALEQRTILLGKGPEVFVYALLGQLGVAATEDNLNTICAALWAWQQTTTLKMAKEQAK